MITPVMGPRMNPSPMVMVVMPVEAAMVVVMVTVVAMPMVTMAMAMPMMATACLGFSRSSGQTNSARHNTGNKKIFEHLVPFKHKLFVAR